MRILDIMEARKVKDNKGRLIDPPRLFYRGRNPGSTLRIRTGDDYWDDKLFVSSNLDGARLYGSEITAYEALPEAKIVYEGTREFISLAKGLKGSFLFVSSAIAKRAEEAGYDAVWFRLQSDIGTVIINRSVFKKIEIEIPPPD